MKPIIALDADGVLLDYNRAYAGAWERAFGQRPAEADPHAYWAMDGLRRPVVRPVAITRSMGKPRSRRLPRRACSKRAASARAGRRGTR